MFNGMKYGNHQNQGDCSGTILVFWLVIFSNWKPFNMLNAFSLFNSNAVVYKSFVNSHKTFFLFFLLLHCASLHIPNAVHLAFGFYDYKSVDHNTTEETIHICSFYFNYLGNKCTINPQMCLFFQSAKGKKTIQCYVYRKCDWVEFVWPEESFSICVNPKHK